MSFFIETADNSIFEMDATVEVGYTQSGVVSAYAVEAGFKVSDNYSQDPDTVSFKGQVSEVKFLTRRVSKNSTTDAKTFEEFESQITDLKKSGEFFSCSFSPRLPALQNCLFTSLRMEAVGKFALDINFTITQVQVATRAKNVKGVIPAKEYEDTVEAAGKGSGATTDKKAISNQPVTDLMVKSFDTARRG
tara:strand:- start:897 stop:1469 length:573 start_codon:yes stop_codon:yes gene_type:complete